MKEHLEPLAIASNVTQAGDTRCDHVLMLLGRLYKVYNELRSRDCLVTGGNNESHPVTSIIKSIEKRWAKADQDLFIACLFLNPLIDFQLLNQSTVPLGVIFGILRRLYSRVYQVEDLDVPTIFTSNIIDYRHRRGRYAPTDWPISIFVKDGVRGIYFLANIDSDIYSM